jgi:diadenylate cyclase
MDLLRLVEGLEVEPVAILDVALTALLIYGLFSLIQGTRAVRLVIGVTVLYGIYVLAQVLNLQLLSQIMQAGAVVGLFAVVVVFQPELRRVLERLGRVGSMGWLLAPGSPDIVDRVAPLVARTAARLGVQRTGALIVIERETGLEDAAESGVMLHADLSPELLQSIFTQHTALHDGAVILRGDRVLAAGVVLPLSETSMHRERFGTRHRAALGITEQTDAVAIVVSEESGSVSLVERGRILRNLDEERLRTALIALLRSTGPRGRAALAMPARGGVPWERGLRLRGPRSRRGRGRKPPADTSVTAPVPSRAGAHAPAAPRPGGAPVKSGPASRAE